MPSSRRAECWCTGICRWGLRIERRPQPSGHSENSPGNVLVVVGSPRTQSNSGDVGGHLHLPLILRSPTVGFQVGSSQEVLTVLEARRGRARALCVTRRVIACIWINHIDESFHNGR